MCRDGSHRGAEPFEYIADERRVELNYVVSEKTPEAVQGALAELLLGLARVQAASVFWRPLGKSERRAPSSRP